MYLGLFWVHVELFCLQVGLSSVYVRLFSQSVYLSRREVKIRRYGYNILWAYNFLIDHSISSSVVFRLASTWADSLIFWKWALEYLIRISLIY